MLVDYNCYKLVFTVVIDIISIVFILICMSVRRSTGAPYVRITPHVQENTNLYFRRGLKVVRMQQHKRESIFQVYNQYIDNVNVNLTTWLMHQRYYPMY